MGPAFANLLEIGGEGRHEKRPDIEVRPFLQLNQYRSEVWRLNHLCLTLI